jgi:drug/metabolite transporter superfamily protein YnfA
MCNIKIMVYVEMTPCSLEGGYHTWNTLRLYTSELWSFFERP